METFASGMKKLHGMQQAGCWQARKQLHRKGLEALGGHVNHESAICCCRDKSQPPMELHWQEHSQWVEGCDYFALFSTHETACGALCQFGAPQYKTLTCWSKSSKGPSRPSGNWKTWHEQRWREEDTFSQRKGMRRIHHLPSGRV